MRSSKVLVGGLTVLVAFLLATNPVVVEAAGKISGSQIKKNSITSKQIKDASLLSADFGAGQIPAGPQGPQGAQGPAGPVGPIGAINGVINPIATGSPYVFVGPTKVMTLTASSKLVSAISMQVQASAGTPSANFDVCHQLNSTGVLTSATADGYQISQVSAVQKAIPVGGVSAALPAGSYKVGPCAFAISGPISAGAPISWATGFIQVVPAATASRDGSAQR